MLVRTQFDPRLAPRETFFPESVVQSGMSPSISEMVRTRRVGGNIDEFQMDGIAEDAPFDSEYVDFFDAMDMADQLSEEEVTSSPAEREAGTSTPQNGGQPQNPQNQEDKVES